MLKKCLYLFFVLVILCTNICYATVVTVTDENLKEALQKFSSSELNKKNYNITVSNNSIIMSANNETYTLKYDLSNKPTFTFEIPIEKGMSYDDFKKQTDKMMLPMVGYIAVANIQGVAVEDASAYLAFAFLGNALNALNGSFSVDTSNSYMIIDDTIKSNNPNAIKISEFGERVMEYVNVLYPETLSFSDTEGINSYTITVEKKDTTETSCKLVSTLSVNLDADFSKSGNFVMNNIEEIKEKVKQESNKTTPTDNTEVSPKLPQTGSNNTILFIIIALAVLAIFIKIKLRKYKDVR